MDIDNDVARWVIEFFVEQPLDDDTIDALIQAFPLTNGNRVIRKKLLLRAIESEISNGSVSEKLLGLLEIFEEYIYQEGIQASQALKVAYCAVAVDCTVRFLKNGEVEGSKGEYFLAVKRIWKQRISRMEKDDSAGLVSEELLEWRDRFEASFWEASCCENVMMRSEWVDAVEAVKVFVKEERGKMGPSFLEYMAETMESDDCVRKLFLTQNKEKHGQIREMKKEGQDQIGEKDNIVHDQIGENNREENVQVGENNMEGQVRVGENNSEEHGPIGDHVHQRNVRELQRGKSKMKPKHVAHKRTKAALVGTSRGAKITDSDDSRVESSHKHYDLPDTPDVEKAQKALETSTMELQAVVKDPLPDALRLASAIMSKENTGNQPTQGNPDNSGNIQTNGEIVSYQCGRQRTNASKPSLMERNSTAHVVEWDTSTDSLSEESHNHATRPTLSSPSRRHVSPLKEYEYGHISKRRKVKRWSVTEENTLRTAVQRFGKGNWKHILNTNREIFLDRTEVDLKDKWRNMERH